MERLYRLFERRFGVVPEQSTALTGSASPRQYFRMRSEGCSCIGVIGTDVLENEAFVALSDHFLSKGIPVPQVFAVSDDGMAYIQEDLGDELLFDRYVRTGTREEGLDDVEELLCRTMTMLPKIQFEGARDLDFNVCHPQREFGKRSVMFDLNYFKYCFLKATGLEFHEMLLQDDFEKLAEDLTGCNMPSAGCGETVATFMYRDFQSRNVMIYGGQPYFIDFQGGRKGPIYYDVASFVWHSRSGYSDSLKQRMLDSYLLSLSDYMKVDRDEFMRNLRVFLLFRYLQVLGAYGFRGWTEHKANFVVSIPAQIRALADLLQEPFERYPYLMTVLKEMLSLERFSGYADSGKGLTVTVTSFSFKKGAPYDPSGNGGGYVFDCRSIHNPGRYEPYKKLTGRDEPVMRFLEDDGEVLEFMKHVYAMVDPHVEAFVAREFTSLMVSFGCTGGQHRSVYCAESFARHIASKYPHVRVRLIHREHPSSHSDHPSSNSDHPSSNSDHPSSHSDRPSCHFERPEEVEKSVK